MGQGVHRHHTRINRQNCLRSSQVDEGLSEIASYTDVSRPLPGSGEVAADRELSE